MYEFTQAIVRRPARSMVAGLTEANLGLPDYDLAVKQHQKYIEALQCCGLNVTILDPEEDYPDSVFIEDVAVLTADCAVITRPGAPSRTGEIAGMESLLQPFFNRIEKIEAPGTLEGGDIMQVGMHLYIGLSHRTNRAGADQLTEIVSAFGMTTTVVAVNDFLHLKTGITSYDEGCFVAAGEFVGSRNIAAEQVIAVPEDEKPAANCLKINGKLIVPSGYEATAAVLTAAGEEIIPVDISEFTKLDGGLTCLSLRF